MAELVHNSTAGSTHIMATSKLHVITFAVVVLAMHGIRQHSIARLWLISLRMVLTAPFMVLTVPFIMLTVSWCLYFTLVLLVCC